MDSFLIARFAAVSHLVPYLENFFKQMKKTHDDNREAWNIQKIILVLRSVLQQHGHNGQHHQKQNIKS